MPPTNLVTIRREYSFEASHRLVYHAGKCANYHGHSYRVQVSVEGVLHTTGPETGMVMDFEQIDQAWKEVERFLDHKHLNDSLALASPTAEVVGRWIFEHLEPLLGTPRAGLVQVSIWETARSMAVIKIATRKMVADEF